MISCHLLSSCALQDCSALASYVHIIGEDCEEDSGLDFAKPGRWAYKCNKAYLGWQNPIRGVQGLAAPALQLLHQAALGVASSRPDAGQHVHKLLICLSECITSRQIAQTSQLKYLPSLIISADTDTAFSGINEDTVSVSALITVSDSALINVIEGFDIGISACTDVNLTQC